MGNKESIKSLLNKAEELERSVKDTHKGIIEMILMNYGSEGEISIQEVAWENDNDYLMELLEEVKDEMSKK